MSRESFFKNKSRQKAANQKMLLLEAAETGQWNLFPSEDDFHFDFLHQLKLSGDELKTILFKAAQANQWDIFAKLTNNARRYQLSESTFQKDNNDRTLYDLVVDADMGKKLEPKKLRALYPLTSHNKPCILFFTTMINGTGDLHNLVNVLSMFYQHPLSKQYEVIVSISMGEGKSKIINSQLKQLNLSTSLPNVFAGEHCNSEEELLHRLPLAQKNKIKIIAQITVSMCGVNMFYDGHCRKEIDPNVPQIGFPEHGFIASNGQEGLIEGGYHIVKGMGFLQESPEHQEYGLFLEPCESTISDLFNYLCEHESELAHFLLGEETNSPSMEALTHFASSHLIIPLYLDYPCLMLMGILSHVDLDSLPFETICFITHKPVNEYITKESNYNTTIYNVKEKEAHAYQPNHNESNKKVKVICDLWLPREQYEILYKIAKVAFCKGPGTLELCIANRTLPFYFPVFPMQKTFLSNFYHYLKDQDYPPRFVEFIKSWVDSLIKINYDIAHDDLPNELETLLTTFPPSAEDPEWLSTACGRLYEEMNFKNTITEVFESILSPQHANNPNLFAGTVFGSSTSLSGLQSGKEVEEAHEVDKVPGCEIPY